MKCFIAILTSREINLRFKKKFLIIIQVKKKSFNPFYEFVIDKTRKNNIFVSFLRWWKLDWIGWSPVVARSLYFIYFRKLSSEYLLENKACLKKHLVFVFVSQMNWSIKLLLCSAKSFRQRWAMWRQLSKRFFSNFSFVKKFMFLLEFNIKERYLEG